MDKIQKINREFYDSHAQKWSANKTSSFFEEKEFGEFCKAAKIKILKSGLGSGSEKTQVWRWYIVQV